MSIKRAIKQRFPKTWNVARTTADLVRLIPRIYGHEERTCLLCERKGRFLAEIHLPDIFVYDAICPTCGSNSRNRLLMLAIRELGLLRSKHSLLHFAPEDAVKSVVAPMVSRYTTADLEAPGVDLKLNIESIDQPSESWDAIICSHVLEHVDHRKALSELRRVLVPGGVLLAMFPIVEAWSTHYENAEVSSPRDKAIHFGKDNHLRRFGRSIRADFLAAGLAVEDFTVPGSTAVRYGLIPGEVLFIGRRT